MSPLLSSQRRWTRDRGTVSWWKLQVNGCRAAEIGSRSHSGAAHYIWARHACQGFWFTLDARFDRLPRALALSPHHGTGAAPPTPRARQHPHRSEKSDRGGEEAPSQLRGEHREPEEAAGPASRQAEAP